MGKSVRGCVVRSVSTAHCSAEGPELVKNRLELETGLPR